MKIQDILGLPLKEGLAILSKSGISTNIIETFSPNNKGKIKDNNCFKDPYIIRIREINDELLEILVSYF
jgi:hypothetical protein